LIVARRALRATRAPMESVLSAATGAAVRALWSALFDAAAAAQKSGSGSASASAPPPVVAQTQIHSPGPDLRPHVTLMLAAAALWGLCAALGRAHDWAEDWARRRVNHVR
jgi:hypothetical protein